MLDSFSEDISYVKGNGDFIEFSRLIIPADTAYIILKDTVDATFFPIDHQGIKDVELDGFSTYTLYYCKNDWHGLDLKDPGD